MKKSLKFHFKNTISKHPFHWSLPLQYKIKLILILIILFPVSILANEHTCPFGPCVIYGPSSTVQGSTVTFTLEGSCATGSLTWTASVGTIMTASSNTCSVYFNTTSYTSATITAFINGSQAASTTITLTAAPALTGGTISNPGQTINYNSIPASINASAATGGACGGSYLYFWSSSTDNVNFSTISGATGQNYQPGQLTVTTYFRRLVSCTGSAYTTDTAQVTVYPQLVSGVISPSSQPTINYNTSPSALTVSAPSGGNGTYTYQWYYNNGSGYQPASNATGTSYTPSPITTATSYEVVTKSNGDSVVSSPVTVNVYPQLIGGSINSAQIINYNTIPTGLTLTGVSGGNGTYTYEWESSTNSSFSIPNLVAINTLTYSPPALKVPTYYRVVVISNGVTVNSNYILINVYPALFPGTLSPLSQTINYNRIPGSLSISGASGGNGTFTYVWQSANAAGGPYTPVGTGSTYSPGSLTSTTWYEVVTTSNGANATSAPDSIIVNPQVIPGSIIPALINIVSGTSPGILTCSAASGGACNGNFVYQWQSSANSINFSNVSGVTGLSYSPGNISANSYYRVRVICGSDTEYSGISQVLIGSLPAGMNYIRQRVISKPGVPDLPTAAGLTSTQDVQQSTRYYDDLGRPIQTVARQASPAGYDMVTIETYDPFGRETTSYLPYTSPSQNGNYKTDPLSEQSNFNAAQFTGEQFFYGQTVYEASALNRVVTTYPAGANWVGANRGVQGQLQVNTISDSVQIWNISPTQGSLPTSSGIYPAGQLYKSITIDEQQHQVVIYKDMDGYILLKKVQLTGNPGTGHAGWLCTYYVYDDRRNLRFAIQPRGVELINSSSPWTIPAAIASELCFRYEYDGRKRVIINKNPGAGEKWMVYDKWDRLVLTQDSNLRVQNQWLYTKYDTLDRVIMTGLFTDNIHQSQLSMQNYLNGLNMARYETYTNTAFPEYTLTQSFPSVSVSNVLMMNYYDDYSWTARHTPIFGVKDNSYDGYFPAPTNTQYPYPQPMVQNLATHDKVTGTWDNGSGAAILTCQYYDDRGRVIQSEKYNYTGGTDISTTQYDFAGKSLQNYIRHQNMHNSGQTHTVNTKLNYDPMGRLKTVWKNIDNASVDQLIDSLQYNELGQLRAKYLGNQLDSAVYDYNVRGWITGINKKYVAGSASNYFGQELAYDNASSVTGTTSYLNTQYNGNVAGTIWKSAGDGVDRKYDFSYDNVNRLTGAAFLQNTSGSSWDNSKIDFSLNSLSYDANGNILFLMQKGFKVGGSSIIDSLVYTYLNVNQSNKLIGVVDGDNDPNSTLGDFHYNQSTKGSTDYRYDGSGNLLQDNNKAISSITYNYLNLPLMVHINGKGTINFIYDALGNKLKKVIMDSTVRHASTTLYLDNFVYQQTDTITNPTGGIDTLQFLSHEEGRARLAFHKFWKGSTGYGWEYDFYQKDHLGNTRVLLSQEKDTASYIATMEAAYRNTENALFYNIPGTSYARKSISGYPNDTTYTNPNDSVARLNPANGQKIGPAIILKVMSGDKVDIGTQYFYASTGTSNDSTLHVADLLTTLATGLVSMSGGMHGTLTQLNTTSGPLGVALNSFITNKEPLMSGKPTAYLNWMLLDNQFNYVSSYPQSGALPVGAGGPQSGGQLQQKLAYTGIPITKSGYLYIYVSNSTPGWDVFFDNLSVTTYSGPMIEENHYYPGGLAMAGISDKALKTNYAANKFRFGGKELQNQEFSDGSGLEEYDFKARWFDPQLMMWHSLDPKADQMRRYSPYTFAFDNPLRYIDPDGMEVQDIIYYNEKGKEIGRKKASGNDRSFVLKTTKKANDIYTKEERNKPNGDKTGPANVNSISSSDADKTKDAIHKGNFESDLVKKNTVEIVNKDGLQKMADGIKDDGTGGRSDNNNREYGGRVDKDGNTTPAKQGDVSHPGEDPEAHINIHGTGDSYHSHPSGTTGDGVPSPEEEKAQDASTGSSSTVGGGRSGAAHSQGPSAQDQNQAGAGTTNYVFGMRSGLIYIYNNTGVVATLPLSIVNFNH